LACFAVFDFNHHRVSHEPRFTDDNEKERQDKQ